MITQKQFNKILKIASKPVKLSDRKSANRKSSNYTDQQTHSCTSTNTSSVYQQEVFKQALCGPDRGHLSAFGGNQRRF
ncbi:MAG: hypothetical protein US54_C0039G0003 [Candidatus Roizmanbacteria bacterium GW2011_GWA2_37_7]|uniref:Uncharacterized protein n=1 Tax=Candidatus Roizmanbacteria bacterium GW2011_GWA2_37_7 TaxID=1618481 RepID=A0A0G0H561_9BACT|nr:MAG: hypothetical protein US54_C0039G0003 [Candidatus Roizmanbacteria bacterium GW2011_GWA2_37_7]